MNKPVVGRPGAPIIRPPARAPVRSLLTRQRIIVSVGLAVAIGLMVIAFQGARDPDPAQHVRPAVVARVFPSEEASALRQEPIGAQLSPDYTGELVVDDRPIPLDQMSRPADPVAGNDQTVNKGLAGLNEISFTPGEGKEFASLPPGRHTAKVLFWKTLTETRDQAQTYFWSFSST